MLTIDKSIWTSYPGEALRDTQGRLLCVPMRNGRLVVAETVEALSESYPMTDQEIRDAPNGVHAFIRHEVKP